MYSEFYLESLEECGINPRQHDIRFEEDNWEAPTLGAWGIGWQVLFDGLEISQFTYFQQAGGRELSPISVELTYGLERIAMALQRVDSVYSSNGGPASRMATCACARRWSNPNTASRSSTCRSRSLRVFTESSSRRYYDFTGRLLQSGLIWPALEHCLKCSHVFNVLDASNSIGVTERTAFILRIRQLAVGIAKAYVGEAAAVTAVSEVR